MEKVAIEIHDGLVRVTGVYFFKNLMPNRIRVKFFYPFPVDSNHFFPDTILINRPHEKDSGGIYFSMAFEPYERDSFTIAYEQRISRRQFRYITTTTKKWRRPLQYAYFTIVTPDTLLLSCNYTFSHRQKIDSKLHYYVEVKNFYPQEDLMITW